MTMLAPWFDDHDVRERVMAEVDDAGGRWIVPGPVPDFVVSPATTGATDTVTVSLDSHYVVFDDHSKLKIEFDAVKSHSTWEYTSYSYHYASPQGFVFRYDKHPEKWFEQKYGTDCHVHDGHPKRKRNMHPTPTVELDEVLDAVIAFQQTGEFIRA
jgi:hypothetical protein